MLLSSGAWIKRRHGENGFSSVGPGTAMPVTTCARPDCRQMDGARYSDPRQRNDALCRTATRDWWNFAENAHPNVAQPRARRLGATRRVSRRAAEGRILDYKIGPHLDRAITGPLPLVGKASGRASGESRAGKGARREYRSGCLTLVVVARNHSSNRLKCQAIQIKPHKEIEIISQLPEETDY